MKCMKWLFSIAAIFLFMACTQQENPREPGNVIPEVKKIQPIRRFERIGGRSKSVFMDWQGNVGVLVNDVDLLLLNPSLVDTIARHKNFAGFNIRKIVYWWDQQWQIGRLVALSALDFKAAYFTLTTDGRLQKVHGTEKFGDQKVWGACFQEFIIGSPTQEQWQYLWTVGSSPIIQRWRISSSAGLIIDPYIPVDFSRDDEPVFAMAQWAQWTLFFCNRIKVYAVQQFPFGMHPLAADITGVNVEGFIENMVVVSGSDRVSIITLSANPGVGHPLKGDYTDVEVDQGRKKIYASQLASILVVYDPLSHKSQTLAVDTDYITAVLLMKDQQHLAIFDTKGRANIFLINDLLAGQNMQENNGAVYAP